MLALPLALAFVGSAAQDPPTILVGEAMVPVSSLAGDLGSKERAQVTDWIEWGSSLGYEAVLDESRRVLLLSPIDRKPVGKRSRATRKSSRKSRANQSALSTKLALIEATLASADALFPMPSERAPEGEERGDWLGATERDSLPVLIELRGPEGLPDLLTHIEESHPYLEQWARGAAGYSGFTLSRPLVGAWVAAGDGLEEWSPNNELVNRLTRLLLVERYGRQPRWLDLGLAWQAEMSIMDSVYCFPARAGFVHIEEHVDWNRALRRLHKDRTRAFSLSEVTSMPRGTFSGDAMRRSWGVAEFLVKRHAASIRPLLSDLAEDRLVHGRTYRSDGTWQLIVDYEPSATTQEALLHELIGEGTLDELAEFLREGAK